MSLSKFSRRDSSPSSSDSELERLLSKIKRPRVRKRLFRPSSAVITVGSDSSTDGDFKANPEIGTHKTKDKVNKVILFINFRGRDREHPDSNLSRGRTKVRSGFGGGGGGGGGAAVHSY